MNKKLSEPIGDVTWHTPPEHQGQMIQVSYGIDAAGDCWQRTDDHSSRTLSFRRLGHQTDPECESWEPWNEVPGCAKT